MGWSLRRRPDGTRGNALAFPDRIGDQDRLLPTGRLEAFSDGVFAIAITLLVLELHVPGRGEVLVRSLEHEWSRYLAYVVSFAFIGGVWIAHSNMTRFIKAADSTLMRLNLTLLLFVSLLPFTTAIAATHVFYLAVSVLFIVEPLRHLNLRRRRAAQPRPGARKEQRDGAARPSACRPAGNNTIGIPRAQSRGGGTGPVRRIAGARLHHPVERSGVCR